MNKKIYITEFEGISLYDDKMGVSAKIVFKDTQTSEEIQNMRKSRYLILCDEESNKNLIKYLEDFISKTDEEVNIKGNYLYLAWSNAYKDLLERIKNNNYE